MLTFLGRPSRRGSSERFKILSSDLKYSLLPFSFIPQVLDDNTQIGSIQQLGKEMAGQLLGLYFNDRSYLPNENTEYDVDVLGRTIRSRA